MKLEVIRSDLARGLSPEQIAATRPSLGVSKSTIYRWADEGYGGMSNMELRRKVGYKPRRRRVPRRRTPHSDRRSHAAFLALPRDERDGCWEMDAVEGRAGDSAVVLTLLNRAARFQLALPLASQTSAETVRALGALRALLGEDGVRRVFAVVLTDNGSEFADEAGIATALCERPGETRLFYCDPMRSDQKGACERNHVEIRKLLPKGRGISFDRLAPADCALLMGQVNSEPRGSLAFMCPSRMLLAAYGDDARALLDGLGIEVLDPSELDLTPGCIERARAERGGRAADRVGAGAPMGPAGTRCAESGRAGRRGAPACLQDPSQHPGGPRPGAPGRDDASRGGRGRCDDLGICGPRGGCCTGVGNQPARPISASTTHPQVYRPAGALKSDSRTRLASSCKFRCRPQAIVKRPRCALIPRAPCSTLHRAGHSSSSPARGSPTG